MSSKYPTILKLKEKEAELEQDMNRYRALYTKYLQVVNASLKGNPINEGKFPYNVIRDDGQIGNDLTVDKQSCFRSCLDDNKCVYALYSNNKKDSKEPNVCKLYDAAAGGLKKVNSKVEKPYHALEKTEWQDKQNVNAMYQLVSEAGSSNNSWKFLGKTDTLEECKNKAITMEQEFSKVTFTSDEAYGDFNKTCYGNVIGGRDNLVGQSGITTSYPPPNYRHGMSTLGGDVGLNLLNQLRALNDKIDTDIGSMKVLLTDVFPKGLENQKKINEQNSQLKILTGKLNNDREELKDVLRELDSFSGENDDLSLTVTSDAMVKTAWTLGALVIGFITFKQIIK